MDVAAEHDLIHFGRHHDKAFHHDAEQKTHERTDHGKQKRLAIDVGVDFARGETEHLQRGDFADALGDVDVRQVVEHDERE